MPTTAAISPPKRHVPDTRSIPCSRRWQKAGRKCRESVMSTGQAKGARMIDGKAPPAYSLTARALHWITAVLVLTLLPLGLVITNDWGGPLQDPLYDLH